MRIDFSAEEVERFERVLLTAPNKFAGRLLRVIKRNFIDAKKEMGNRSDFEGSSLNRVMRSIKIEPEGRSEPKRIDAVEGSIYTGWRGLEVGTGKPASEGVARLIEKKLGVETVSADSGPYLAIPLGRFRTAQDRPRRKAWQKFRAQQRRDTTVVPTSRGVKLIVQRRGRGASKARQHRENIRRGGTTARTEVVGMLVKRVRVHQGLDWEGSWESLRRARIARYDRMLSDMAKAFSR